MLKHYFTIALRNLRNNKMYSFINFAGLSISICAAFLIFFYCYYLTHYYSTFETHDRIYQVLPTSGDNPDGQYSSPYLLAPKIYEQTPGIEAFSRMIRHRNSFLQRQNTDNSFIAYSEPELYVVDSTFFQIFPYKFIYGDPNTALAQLKNVVLEEATAQQYFGKSNPLGEILKVNGNKELIVSGVIKVPENIHEAPSALTRIDYLQKGKMNHWDQNGPSYVLLEPGITAFTINDRLADFSIINPRPKEKTSIGVHLLNVAEINSYWNNGDALTLLLYIACFILLIAALNSINLINALNTRRLMEFMVKRVMGSRPIHSIQQYIVELSILILICILSSTLLIVFVWPWFQDMVDIEASLYTRIYFFPAIAILSSIYLAVFLFITFIHALEKLRLWRNRHRELKAVKHGMSTFSNISIFVQFMLSSLLIIGSVVVIKQRNLIQNTDLGVNYQRLIHLNNNSMIMDKFEVLRHELINHPNISHVSSSSAHPTNIGNNFYVNYESNKDVKQVDFNFLHVYGDFFKTFELQFLYGNPFNPQKTADRGFIINETGLKALGILGDPIGQEIEFWGVKDKIAGVVEDFHHQNLYQQIRPLIFVSNDDYRKGWSRNLYIKHQHGDLSETMSFVKTTFQSVISGAPFEMELLDSNLDRRYENIETINQLLLIGSAVTLLSSVIGLLGLVMFYIARKQKEIAIRKVNGAEIKDLILLIQKRFLTLIGIAFLVASPLAWMFMSEWLGNFAYRIDVDVFVFLLSGSLVFVTVMIIVGYKTIKAARANPAETLKHE